MNKPLISIVVPIYNSESQLDKCIESLLNQTYKNLEIILIDDGSKDSSWEICKEYESKDLRIKAIHKENGGVSSARNLGIEHATGEYIGFLDSDDYVEPVLYEDLINKLAEYPDLDGIRYQYRSVYGNELREKSSTKNAGLISINDKNKAMRLILIDNEFPSVALFLFKRANIKHRFNEKINTAEDYLFMMHYIMDAEKVYITNTVYYYYVYNQNSITRSSINLEKSLSYLKSQLTVCRVADKYIEKYSLDDLREFQEKDIREVISYNINNLFPEVSYAQYKQYIRDIRALKEFRYLNRHHKYDSVLKERYSFFFYKKWGWYIKRALKK